MEAQENTAGQHERATLLLLLQDREYPIQDVRQERDAWRQQAERAPQRLVVTAGA